MNFLGSQNRERHQIFDVMQAETTRALDIAAHAEYMERETANDLYRLAADGFVPNVKHGVATMPRALKGTERLPIIPLFIGEVVDIAALDADFSETHIRRTAEVTGLDIDFIQSLSAAFAQNPKTMPNPIGFPERHLGAGITSSKTMNVTRDSDGRTYAIPLRRIVGVSVDTATRPGIFAHELRHVVDFSEWPFSAPDLCDNPERHDEKMTLTERNAYAVTYVLDQIRTGGMLPDYRTIGELFKGADVEEAFDDMCVTVLQNTYDSYTHFMPTIANVITYAFGPEDPADFPTPAEVAGYGFAEIY